MNRNLSSFATGYNYQIQIMPVLIVGSLFLGADGTWTHTPSKEETL